MTVSTNQNLFEEKGEPTWNRAETLLCTSLCHAARPHWLIPLMPYKSACVGHCQRLPRYPVGSLPGHHCPSIPHARSSIMRISMSGKWVSSLLPGYNLFSWRWVEPFHCMGTWPVAREQLSKRVWDLVLQLSLLSGSVLMCAPCFGWQLLQAYLGGCSLQAWAHTHQTKQECS